MAVGCLTPDTFTPLSCLDTLGLQSDKPLGDGAMLVSGTRDWQVFRAALSAWAAAMRMWGRGVGETAAPAAAAARAAGGGNDDSDGIDGSRIETNAVMVLLVAPILRVVKWIIGDMRECEQTMAIAIATGSAVKPVLLLCRQFQLLQLVWVVRGLLLLMDIEMQVAGKEGGCASKDNSTRGSSRAASGRSRSSRSSGKTSKGKPEPAAAASVATTSSSSAGFVGGSGRGEFQQQQQEEQQQQGQLGILHQARCLLEHDSTVLDMMHIVVSMLWASGGSRVVVEGAEEVVALLRAQHVNTLHAAQHHTPPGAPRGAAAASIMQVALLRERAARAKEVEGGVKEGNASASMLTAAAPVGGAREKSVAGGSALAGEGAAAAECPEAATAGGGSGTLVAVRVGREGSAHPAPEAVVQSVGPAAAAGAGECGEHFPAGGDGDGDGDASSTATAGSPPPPPPPAAAAAGVDSGGCDPAADLMLLQMLAGPDLAAAAVAAVPAAAATDPLAFCSSIIRRVRGIRLLPEAVVEALEGVAALQGTGEGGSNDGKQNSAGSTAGEVSVATAVQCGGSRESSGGATVSGVVIEGHQAGWGSTEEDVPAEAPRMDPTDRGCDEALQAVVGAGDREVFVTAAMIELLHVFVAEVPLPVGCNHPHCAAAADEAVATRKCTGCKLAVYCSDGCLKEHWKEHKGLCRRVQAARVELAGNGGKHV